MPDNSQYQDPQGELDVPEQPLSQDYDTPAAPPEEQDADNVVPADHPSLDTGIDAHQLYDEGVKGASEVDAQHVDADEEAEKLEQ